MCDMHLNRILIKHDFMDSVFCLEKIYIRGRLIGTSSSSYCWLLYTVFYYCMAQDHLIFC